MVGGVVIGVTRTESAAHVNVADCPHYPKHERGQCPRPDTCCVYTDEVNCTTGERVFVSPGDSFWWQCGKCYWTPKEKIAEQIHAGTDGRCGVDYDIPLTKIGYSH